MNITLDGNGNLKVTMVEEVVVKIEADTNSLQQWIRSDLIYAFD